MSIQSPRRVLYISWEGDAQNYMESLFLPILSAAQSDDLQFEVCLFSWADEATRQRIERTAASFDVDCTAHGVLRRPPVISLAGMIAYGVYTIVKTVKAHNIDAVFSRGSMPSLMVLAAQSRLPSSCKWFFDADGFSADERADFGYWNPEGPFYRVFRDVESQAARRAAGVMARTEKAKTILLNRIGAGGDPDKIHVIPNAKDGALFTPQDDNARLDVRNREGVPEDAPWLIYVGSIGQQYYPAEMVRLFERVYAAAPNARFHILTGQEDVIRKHITPDHPASAQITVKRVRPEEIPGYLASADLGVSLRMPSYSQQGVCPIKNAEYLLCGLPVVSTRGVGDMDEVFQDNGVGFICDTLEDDSLDNVATWLLDEVIPNRDTFRTRCRDVGVQHFSLETCGEDIRCMILEAL